MIPIILEQLPTSLQQNCGEKMWLRWDTSTLYEFRLLSHPLFRLIRWDYRHTIPKDPSEQMICFTTHHLETQNCKKVSPSRKILCSYKKKKAIKKHQSSMKICSPELLIKWLTIPYISTADCHSTKIFVWKVMLLESKLSPFGLPLRFSKRLSFYSSPRNL